MQMLLGGGGSFSTGGPGKGLYSRLCKSDRYVQVHSEFELRFPCSFVNASAFTYQRKSFSRG